jgi:hypothetical protein
MFRMVTGFPPVVAVNDFPDAALATRRKIGFPMQIRIPHVVRRAIEDLPPYPSLLVVAVPLAIVEPLKLTAVFIMGDGHLVVGTLSILCAYAVSLFLTERLFGIVKPKLLRLSWFAAVWRPFIRIRGRVLRWFSARLGINRKGLWVWDDSQ